MDKKKTFKEYLEEIEDPKNNQEVNYALPENPTSLQVAKYKVCKKILLHQMNSNLTDKEIADKIGLDKHGTENVLFCHIEEFTLDQLTTYANKLLIPSEIVIEERTPYRLCYNPLILK